jgi:hypothetical protein
MVITVQKSNTLSLPGGGRGSPAKAANEVTTGSESKPAIGDDPQGIIPAQSLSPAMPTSVGAFPGMIAFA